MRSYCHPIGDYLRAALAVGLEVRRCEEPPVPVTERPDRTGALAPWDLWPWALADLVPEAARAVNEGASALVIWHFRRR